MTTFERFEREIPELMSELAPVHVPDYFDDLLRQTASHGQRPAWSYPERWLPVDITARPLTTRSVPWRPLLVMALVALAIVAALVAYAGSRPHVPAPFGEARNGLLVYRADNGAILTIDPSTGARGTIADPSAKLGDPVPSRNGTRVAYVPSTEDVPQPVIISTIDGSHRTPLDGTYVNVSSLDWSPDDSHVAFVSAQQQNAITVAVADGSGAATVPLDGRAARDLWYLPDGRLAIMAAAEPGDFCPRGVDYPIEQLKCSLFVVNTDGTGLHPVVPGTAYHGLDLHPSADGTKLVYVEWQTGAEGRLHVIDILAGTDVPVAVDGLPDSYNINHAWFSPDGASILFDLFGTDASYWAVVPSGGGPLIRMGRSWHDDQATEASWAPDGRSVLAWYQPQEGSSQLWLLDPTAAGADKQLPFELPGLPAWQRAGT